MVHATASQPPPICLRKTFKASVSLFQDVGVEQTSLDDISTATGVTKDRLGDAFHSSDNLYRSIVRWHMDRFEHQVLVEFAMHSNPVDALRCVLYECIETFSSDREPRHHIISDIPDHRGLKDFEISRLMMRLNDRLHRKLEQCAASLYGRHEIEELSHKYTAILHLIIRNARNGKSHEELYHLADESLSSLTPLHTFH